MGQSNQGITPNVEPSIKSDDVTTLVVSNANTSSIPPQDASVTQNNRPGARTEGGEVR